MKELSPKRQKEYELRVKHVLDKETPNSYRYRWLYEAYFEIYKTLAKTQLAFAESVFPLCDPTEHTACMKKMASRMLLMVAALGDVERGRTIIRDLKADVNYQDTNGYTPLSYAICRKRLGMVEMLLENGAKANKHDKQHLTPLLKACSLGIDKAIPVFARHQVDLNQKISVRKWNKFGLGWKTWHVYPLAYALVEDKPRVVAELLKQGADLDVSRIGNYSVREAFEKDKEFKLGVFSAEMRDIVHPYLMIAKQKIRE